MPVVTVQCTPHPEVAALLTSVANAVAMALKLSRGDVIATHVAAGETVQNGVAGAAAPWIVVTIQGSARGRGRMDAARASADDVVREWADERRVAIGGVWTQWLVPMPIAP